VRWLTAAQDDLGALLSGSILLVRRGLLAAIVSSLTLGALGVALVALAAWASPVSLGFAVILGPILVSSLLYAGPLAAFAIALERRPAIRETLGRALRRLPALSVIAVPGAVMGSGLVALSVVAIQGISAPPSPGPTSGIVPALLLALFGFVALVAVLRMWARYFLFPAACAVADGLGIRAAYARSEILAAKHRLVFAAATALPLCFVVAAIPDPTSQSAAHGVLDPRGVALLRVLVGGAATFASLLACAALSIAAYGLASGRLDAAAPEPHDSGLEP
jgi:hypothetical protein